MKRYVVGLVCAALLIVSCASNGSVNWNAAVEKTDCVGGY